MITKGRKEAFLKQRMSKERYDGPITGFSECAGCGECCRKNACNCVPADFEDLSVKGIEEILDTGKYMITAFYNQAKMPNGIPIEAIPVIAAREVNCKDNGIHITMLHATCAMLGLEGCKLCEDERPSQGLMLIPDGEGCKCLLDVPTVYWEAYSKTLNEVVKKRTGKTVQELFEEELIPLAKDIKHKIQYAVVYGGKISVQEHMAAVAMRDLGVFYGLFGEELGAVMDDFVSWVEVVPV